MTYIHMTRDDLVLAAAALSQLTIAPAKQLQERLLIRVGELDDTDVQARWDAYRGAVPTAEGTIECDEGALVSEGDDPGAYAMVWVWVPDSDAGLCEVCKGPNDNGEGWNGMCGDYADKAEPEDDEENDE